MQAPPGNRSSRKQPEQSWRNAHHRDSLGNLNLIEADYAWVTRRLMEIAKRRCGSRVVSVLEGGYDLDALARSVAAHVTGLMEG